MFDKMGFQDGTLEQAEDFAKWYIDQSDKKEGG
jgi:hypothetical protein